MAEEVETSAIAARIARERGTTYVLMGIPRARRGLSRFSTDC